LFPRVGRVHLSRVQPRLALAKARARVALGDAKLQLRLFSCAMRARRARRRLSPPSPSFLNASFGVADFTTVFRERGLRGDGYTREGEETCGECFVRNGGKKERSTGDATPQCCKCEGKRKNSAVCGTRWSGIESRSAAVSPHRTHLHNRVLHRFKPCHVLIQGGFIDIRRPSGFRGDRGWVWATGRFHPRDGWILEWLRVCRLRKKREEVRNDWRGHHVSVRRFVPHHRRDHPRWRVWKTRKEHARARNCPDTHRAT
jgi:hypothetical protein